MAIGILDWKTPACGQCADRPESEKEAEMEDVVDDLADELYLSLLLMYGR